MKIAVDRYGYFFFDFDGVIVDSVKVKTEAFARLYAPYGSKIVSQVVKHHLSHGGIDRFRKIRYYHRHFLGKEISQEHIMLLADKFARIVIQRVIRARFIPGARKFLKMVRDLKKNAFVVSATPEKEINMIARAKGIYPYFAQIKGAPLSKTENLRYLVKKYRVNPKDALYFGDAKEDCLAAKECGISFIPLNYYDKNKGGFKNFSEIMDT